MANPYFNAVYYLQQNPDVFSAGYTVATAWDHYVKHGANEANVVGGTFRAPNPWFDVKYYLANNPDLVRAGITPATALDHFLTYGSTAGEDRAPNATIAAAPITEAKLLAYAKANADLQTAFGISASATTLTAAQQTSLLNHFYAYGYNETRADKPAAVTIPDVDAGKTFTLTKDVDVFNVANGKATSGDDTYTATWRAGDVANSTLNLGDSIDAGPGVDSFEVTTANSTGATTALTGFTLTNVDKVFVTATGATAADTTTFDASRAKDATELWSSGSSVGVLFGSNAATAIAKNAAIGLKDTTQNVTATFADTLVSGAADTGTVALGGGVGTSAAQPTVTLNGVTVANGFETINVVSSGSANYIAALNSGTNKIETVKLSGSANVRIDAIGSTALKSVDASALTGGASANVNVTTSTSTSLKFVGSAGNDRLVIDGTNAANTFSLNGGEGKDTLAVADGIAFVQSAAAPSALLVGTVNKATAFEVLEATNAATRALKANDFTAINEFVFSTSATVGAGAATIAITGVETADKFTIGADQAAVAGNVGGASASAATNALTFTGASPGQTASVVLSSTTGVDVLGGAGGAGQVSGSAAGAAGAAAIAFGGAVSTLKIESTGSAANTIVGGVGGDGGSGSGAGVGGAAAVAIDNGTSVQSVVITGTQNLSILGGGAGATGASSGAAGGAASVNAFSNSISVDASALEAKLTIAGSAQADVIKVGTKGSEVRATDGADSITLGAGNDIVVYTNASQSLTGTITDDTSILNSIDKIDSWGVGTDKVDVKATTLPGTGYASADYVAQNVVQAAVDAVSPTSLKQAAEVAATNIGADKIGVFQYGGNTYILGNDATPGTLAAGDLLVQVVGAHQLTADNFVFA